MTDEIGGISPGIGRRGFMAASSMLLTAGCVHCAMPKSAGPVETQICDAHAHFFNVADLPVAGFAKFVLITRYFKSFPDFGESLVDIVAWVAKVLALSAHEELGQLTRSGAMKGAPSKETDFAREAARAHRAGLAGTPLDTKASALGPFSVGQREIGLQASHRALAALFNDGAASAKNRGAMLDERDFLNMIKADPAAMIKGSMATPPPVRAAGSEDDPDLQCVTKPPETEMSQTKKQESVRTLLRWVWLMCQPRSCHVIDYLKTITIPKGQVTDAINLLVDYDKWLNDHPADGSSMADQVEYWTRYSLIAAGAKAPIKVHSFAGFDPLRDAEERVLDKRPEHATTLHAMMQWALDGKDEASTARHKIAGFKVYPPMGFSPDSNAGLEIPPVRGGTRILNAWKNSSSSIGAEIDVSLNCFYKFCLKNDIPLMSHARESNIALPDVGEKASPGHWVKLAERLALKYPDAAPLRLCFGHFDMRSCRDAPSTDRDALFRALVLNRKDANGRRKARLYFDISFDSEILKGNGKKLFEDLAVVCKDAQDDGDFILFGSDWIMLANQANAKDFLTMAYDSAMQVGFWQERIKKLFETNFRTFMTPTDRLTN